MQRSLVVIDVSGQPIGPVFVKQSDQNAGNTYLRSYIGCVRHLSVSGILLRLLDA